MLTFIVVVNLLLGKTLADISNNPFLKNKVAIDHNKYENNPFLNGDIENVNAEINTNHTNVTDICGQSSVLLVRGGTSVQDGEFPWLGALFKHNGYLCTVNLVTQKQVITAAHCFVENANPRDYSVKMGLIMSNEKYMKIQKIDSHPQYELKRSAHDVALVTLEKPISFSNTIKPICLWDTSLNSLKTPGVIAGFGPNYTDCRKLQYPIVTQEQCRESHPHFNNLINSNTFCAGTKDNRGPCLGDSGAGFMQTIQERYHLRGIVSLSLSANGDCNLRQYIIFADLATECEWIADKLKGQY